jgi:hypothetical protein
MQDTPPVSLTGGAFSRYGLFTRTNDPKEDLMPEAQKWTTREDWLIDAGQRLRKQVFTDHDIPAYRVSVGWPGGRGKKSSTIGQCWNASCSEDGIPQVFVSPVVKAEVEVLRVLVHEMIHVFDNCEHGHRGTFLQVFRAVGMAGKATECEAGPELAVILVEIVAELGPYPHAALRPSQRTGKVGEKKQTSRQLLVQCSTCGYKARTTRQWLDDVGAPICPCINEQMEEVKS